jgi:hypothetical protein
MRRALIISLTGALALPIFAGEPKKEPQPQPQTAAQTAAAPAKTDSKLVKAAKLSNRRNGSRKGTIVITNETLRSGKGHITTTAAQPPLRVPEPKPGPEQLLAEKQAKRAAENKKLEDARAEAARKAAEHREKVRREGAEQAEEGIYESMENDPAAAEHAAEIGSEKKPPL